MVILLVLTNFKWKLVIILSYLWLMFGTYLLNFYLFWKMKFNSLKFNFLGNNNLWWFSIFNHFHKCQEELFFLSLNLSQIILCQTSIEGILIYEITKKPITIKPTQWYGIYSKIFGHWIFVMKYSIIRG